MHASGWTGGGASRLLRQLALLKEHRLVRCRRDGKMIFYALDDRHVRAVVAQGLAHAEHSWSEPEKPPARPRAKPLRSGRPGAP